MNEESIFSAALEKPLPERAGYLAQACGQDETMRKRLEGLLAASAKVGDFMASPAAAPASDPAATQALSTPPDSVPAGGSETASISDEEPLTFLAPPGRGDSLGRLGHYEVLQLLALGAELTDVNGALFDPAHQFAGCIAGIHEVLRRQGLVAGRWCLDPHEDLSPGQMGDIDRVLARYPHLSDDAFVREHLDRWLR